MDEIVQGCGVAVIANISLHQVIEQIIYVAHSIDVIRKLYPLSKQSNQTLNNTSILAYLHAKYDLYRRPNSYSELIKLYHYQYVLEFPFYDSYYQKLTKAISDGDPLSTYDFLLSSILESDKMKAKDRNNLFYLAGRRQDGGVLYDLLENGIKRSSMKRAIIREFLRGRASAGSTDDIISYTLYANPPAHRFLDLSEEIGKSGNISSINMILEEYAGHNFKIFFKVLKGVIISGNVENFNHVIGYIKNEHPDYDYGDKLGTLGVAAARSGNIEMFRVVRSHTKIKYNLKALGYHAALGGHLNMINHLLEKTPSNKKQRMLSMIYFTACISKHVHVLKRFEQDIHKIFIPDNRVNSTAMDRYVSAVENGLITPKFLELDSINVLFYELVIKSRDYVPIKYLLSIKLDFRKGTDVLLLSPYNLDKFPSYDVNTGKGGGIVGLGESTIALLSYYLKHNTNGVLI